MNPFRSSKPNQVALVLTIMLGVVLGLVVGYFAFGTEAGTEGNLSFWDWFTYRYDVGVWWALGGAIAAATWLYVKLLVSGHGSQSAL
jgi:hypothetical protein